MTSPSAPPRVDRVPNLLGRPKHRHLLTHSSNEVATDIYPDAPRSAEFCRRKTNVTYLNVATNTHGAEKAHSYTAHYNASTVHIPT